MFEDLEEYINENSVVTYKWLSQKLQIHVNQAKQMLHAYILSKRDEKLHVSYIVTGLNDSKNYVVFIIREEQLDSLKSSLHQVISYHVYSVQRSTLKSLDVLYAVDSELSKNDLLNYSKYSSITCPSVRIKTRDDQVKHESQNTTISSSSSSQKVVDQAAKNFFNSNQGKESSKAACVSKEKSKTKSLFFGSNTGGKPANSKKVDEIKPETKVEKKKADESVNKEATDRKKKASSPLDDIKQSKRRKVLKIESDEESSDEEMKAAEEELALRSNADNEAPPKEPLKETDKNGNTNSVNESFEKKMVTKTYVNDEGFMVTEKVYEKVKISSQSKTQTVNSTLQKVKEPNQKGSVSDKKKTSSKRGKQKQSNMMSFFQKK